MIYLGMEALTTISLVRLEIYRPRAFVAVSSGGKFSEDGTTCPFFP